MFNSKQDVSNPWPCNFFLQNITQIGYEFAAKFSDYDHSIFYYENPLSNAHLFERNSQVLNFGINNTASFYFNKEFCKFEVSVFHQIHPFIVLHICYKL